MTEPDAPGADRPIGETIKDAIDDIVNPSKQISQTIGDTIGDIAEQIVSNQPAGGGGAIAGIGGGLQDIFVDKDGDGTPDIFEQVGKMGVPRREITHVRDDAKVQDFLQNALAQIGDKYQRGVENSLGDADPDRWDGSELVEWAANRAGVMVNDGAANQYRQMTREHGDLSVDDALQTPGAILYEFTGDPINGTPTRASTAISLGDGRIIDIDPKEGVRIIDAAGINFTHAAVMPGFTDAKDPGAGALNVVHDALVKHGIEEAAPPVEDTPEIAALAARAAELRAHYINATFGEGRTERGEHHSEVERQQKLAEVGLQMANEELTSRQQKADERLARAADLETQATAAETRGDTSGAQELREDAARTRLAGESDRDLAEHARDQAAKYQQQLDAAKSEMAKIDEATGPRFELVGKGEDALDQLEQKVELMRTAHAQATLVTDLERREAEARSEGDTVQADQLAKQAQSARATADRLQQAADGAAVDEPTLKQIQDLPAPTTTGTPPAGDAAPDGAASTPTPDTPTETDQPDTPEIEQLAQRAAHLREQSLAAIRAEAVDREGEYTAVKKEFLQAESMVEYSDLRGQAIRNDQQAAQSRADDDERRAAEAQAKGDTRAAEELREHAARMLVVVQADEQNAAKMAAEHEQYKGQAAQMQQRLDTMDTQFQERVEKLNDVEDAIDALEDRVRSLREIQTQNAIAEDLDRQAAATRAGGDAAEAQQLADEAAAHRAAAGAEQTRLDATTVDETALQVLENVDVTTEPPASGDIGIDIGSDPMPTDAPGITSDPIGDADPVAPAATAPNTTVPEASDGAIAEDPVAAAVDAPDAVIADVSFADDDAALGVQDFTVPDEQEPDDDTSVGDEL